MVWKPKEKELTLEEAVAQAKKELAPYWIGSEPLVAAVRDAQGKTSVFPLAKDFTTSPRAFLFADPTQPASEFLLQYGREWGRRYQSHGCAFLAVVRLPYTISPDAPELQNFAHKRGLGFPVVLDRDGLLAEALAGPRLPSLALVHEGKTIFTAANWEQSDAIELRLQEYLRRKDPGLPMRPPFSRGNTPPAAATAVEFGKGRGHPFPTPGFQPGPGGFDVARFGDSLPEGKLKAGEFHFRGNWIQDVDRIVTQDPDAAIAFHASRANVAVVGQCVSKIGGTGRMVIEVDGRPVFEVFAGPGVQMDEEGNSRLQLEGLQMYPILKALKPDSRSVCLKFPGAKEFPVALNGFRLWD